MVEDFRDAMMNERGTKLARMLAGMMGDSSIVLCSDVMPPYHLAPGVEEVDVTQPKLGDEWHELITSFDVYVLRHDSSVGDVEKGRWSGIPEIDELLKMELDANADFGSLLLGVAEGLRNCSLSWPHARSSGWFSCFGRLRRWGVVSRLRERALCDICVAAQGRFKALWAVSSFDERAQLYALAHGGSPNVRQRVAISSLVARGLITEKDPMRLRSEAFGRFIVEHLGDSLDDWRRKGQGDWWRVTWLPLVLLAGLGLLFFINANPEAIGVIAAIGAAFVGLVPVITSVFRTGQFVQPTFSPNDE